MMRTRKMDIEEEKEKNFTDLFSLDHKFERAKRFEGTNDVEIKDI